MHPPDFNLHQHRLSNWPNCTMELWCWSPECKGRSSHPPIRMLRAQHGNPTFAELLRRLRCQRCRRPPAPVYLVAGFHRSRCGGPAADWAIELIEPPRPFVPLHGA